MRIGNKEYELGKRTYIMGILNVTPDSFSDGGKFNEIDAAVNQARKLIEDGADIIDIGGESTRPGAEYVTEEEEIKRVVPIDTYKARTAEESIKAGADIINDIWGAKYDKNMAKVAAKYNTPIILMHNRENKPYENLMEDVVSDLQESIDIALKAGVKKENIILDPGIGFAKTYEENLIVMNNCEVIKKLGYPMLLGTSRKSMIGLTLNLPVNERVEGTLATTVMGIINGFEFIRVHDVLENKRAAIMTDTILKAK